MVITGVIAEFNPFHNGHAYLLKKARELSGADLVLVVMSGDFVQRGAPALLDKYARAEMALLCGADLVVELPVWCAAASAEYFAEGAVRLLNDLGADSFVFGCEDTGASDAKTGNPAFPNAFYTLARMLLDEPPVYRSVLKESLSSGLSFPAARRKAAAAVLPEIAGLLDFPNNLLGIEYIKSCIKRNFNIQPIAVARAGNAYHDARLPEDGFASASALRAFFCADMPAQSLSPLALYVPPAAYDILKRDFFRMFPVTENDFSTLIAYRLLNTTPDQLSCYADLGPSLAARLFSARSSCIQTTDLIRRLKTRETTYTRISRALFHLVLEITGNDQETFRAKAHTPYARLLGFTQAARPYLKTCNSLPIPMIQRPARAKQILSGNALSFFEKDIAASQLYRQVSYSLYQTPAPSEYERGVLIL